MPEFKDDAAILFETIKTRIPHQDYNHVNEIATDYTIYSTGAGIEKKLERFAPRETEDMHRQRVNLTIVNTADILNSCVKPLNKVGKTPAMKHFVWEGKDAKQTAENKRKLLKVGAEFWGKQSVEKYLEKRMAQFDKTDPNSFCVVEFKGETRPDAPKELKPYPFEVNSKEAFNYIYKDNILQWLIVKNDILIVDEKGKMQPGELFYGFFEKQTVRCEQVHYTMIEAWQRANPNAIMIMPETDLSTINNQGIYLFPTDLKEGKSDRWFYVKVTNHNFGFVPAFRFGNNMDILTDYRTCVPMVHAAKCYFEDSIQTMSELSLTKRLHVFPQKWTYLPKCQGYDFQGSHISCLKGQTPEGKTCKSCNGSGVVVHTTSQDLIGIPMPDDLSQIADLEKMSTYKGPDIELVKFQKEFGFEDLKRYALGAVYNSGTFGHTKIVKTATENEIDLESVYDTIKDFADHYSSAYVFIYSCIAKVNSLSENFIVTHTFPNDFAMEPLDYLMETLGKANTSGAASHVIKAINDKINKKIYIDEPRQILKLETQDKYQPFQGKTIEEINFILASDLTTQFNKVLHTHFNLIFSELEYDFGNKNIDFYELAEAVQRTAIKTKVNTIIAQLNNESAANAAEAFGTGDEKDPETIEMDEKAKLRGSADGIAGILSIQKSVSEGATTPRSGVSILMTIYGFDRPTALEMLGSPEQNIQVEEPNLN